MYVDVIASIKDISPQKIYGKTVIVLDVLRCTSTVVTALANGCKEVIPLSTEEEVSGLAAKLSPKSFLIAGEVKGSKILGAHLGNSPFEFHKGTVKDKIIIMNTTNGTKAIRLCKPAKHVLAGSFLNISAVCYSAMGYQKDIVIVCSGTRGNIALEDIMAAGCLVKKLKKISDELRITDLARTFSYLYTYFEDNLEQLVRSSRSGLNLQKLGYDKDITYCLQQDKFKVVPLLKQNSMKLNQSLAIYQ